MATIVRRGKAAVEGVTGLFDVILYGSYGATQTADAAHNFDLEVVKDNQGQDAAWRSRNEMVELDVTFKMLADTSAHAKASAAFLAPLAVVTVSTCDIAEWNTTYCVIPGSSQKLKNDQVGDLSVKIRRYVDSTQNTLFAATPT